MNTIMTIFYIWIAGTATFGIIAKVNGMGTLGTILVKLMSVISLMVSLYQLYLLSTGKIRYV